MAWKSRLPSDACACRSSSVPHTVCAPMPSVSERIAVIHFGRRSNPRAGLDAEQAWIIDFVSSSVIINGTTIEDLGVVGPTRSFKASPKKSDLVWLKHYYRSILCIFERVIDVRNKHSEY